MMNFFSFKSFVFGILLQAAVLSTNTGRTVLTGSFILNKADDVCDPLDHDLSGTNWITWAFSDRDPKNADASDMTKHTHHGHDKLMLEQIMAEDEVVPPKDTTEIKVQLPDNYMIPCCHRNMSSPNTLYLSVGIDLYEFFPGASDDHAVYITAWNGFIGNDKNGIQNLDYVHHVNMQPCEKLTDGLKPENWGESKVGVSDDLADCWLDNGHNPITVFVIGMKNQVFPEGTGMKVGGPDGYRYVIMEIHYDIPWYAPHDHNFGDPLPEGYPQPHPQPWEFGDEDYELRDNSGISFWYTHEQLMDIGPFWFGVFPGRNSSTIAPGQDWAHAYSLLGPECMRPYFKPEWGGKVDIKQVLVHGHDFARCLKVHHIRDGVELPLLVEDCSYDNYYQQWFPTDREWREDDVFILECIVDTSQVGYEVKYGLATHSEQCIAFFMTTPWFGRFSPIIWTEDNPGETRHSSFISSSMAPKCESENFTWPEYTPLPMKEDKCKTHPLTDIDPNRDSVPYPWMEDKDGEFDTKMYHHHQVLEEDKCSLHWNFNPMTRRVDFAFECFTTGWMALGFQDYKKNTMEDQDVFFGWVDDDTGEVFAYDAYIFDKTGPKIDFYQQFYNLRGFQDGVMYVPQPRRTQEPCTREHLPEPTQKDAMSWNDNPYQPSSPGSSSSSSSNPDQNTKANANAQPPQADVGGQGFTPVPIVILMTLLGFFAGLCVHYLYRRCNKRNEYIGAPATESEAVHSEMSNMNV